MLSSFIPILFTMFIVVDPFGLVPLFIGLTGGLSAAEKDRTIRKAVATAFLVLSLFIAAGRLILRLLGVSPGSFFIAGGIMLFLVSLDMLFGQPKRSKVSDQEKPIVEDSEERSAIAVFPLAIPMLAGPGAITTIILFTSSGSDPLLVMAMLLVAVILTLAAAGFAMKASGIVLKALGRTGVSVIERIMGLLLSGLAVQFVYEGLSKLGMLPGGAS